MDKLTKTLLDKPAEERTDEENKAVKIYEDLTNCEKRLLGLTNKLILEDCETLFSGTETVPIPYFGWMSPLRRACYELEALNIKYRKHKIWVRTQQIKEKFGGLRFYTEIFTRPTGFVGFALSPVFFLRDRLLKIDFGFERVDKTVDRVFYTELTEEQYRDGNDESGNKIEKNIVRFELDKNWSGGFNPPPKEDTEYLVSNDGYSDKIPRYAIAKAYTFKRFENRCTRHKFLYWVFLKLNGLIRLTAGNFFETREQRVLAAAFGSEVDDIIARATEECGSRCQDCGITIGTEHSPRCATVGWVNYLCEGCAKIRGGEYEKGGKIFIEGKEVEEVEDVENN